MLKNAEWIWNNSLNNDDEYVDFSACFALDSLKNVRLHISVDGMFVAYLNGKLIGFNECSDDEDNKLYDTFLLDDITKIFLQRFIGDYNRLTKQCAALCATNIENIT